MSRQPPPSSAYPPIPRGAPALPPFPQLLHFKEDSPSVMTSTPETHDSIAQVMSPDEEDELLDDGPGDAGSPSHGGGGGSGAKAKKERKPHATRRRVVQSCSECRRRKIKCDKKFPCGPCILRSDQARCHEVGMAERAVVASPISFATTSELAVIAHRLDALEASLLKSGALRPADLDHFLKTLRDGDLAAPSTSLSRSKSKPTHSPSSHPYPEGETVDDTEGAALTLEHLAFGRSRVDGSHSLAHFGARQSSVLRPIPNNDYHLAKMNLPPYSPSNPTAALDNGAALRRKTSLNYVSGGEYGPNRGADLSADERMVKIEQLLDLLGPTDVFDMFYRKTDVAFIALTRLLPSRERGELLVRTYLEKVDWLHRCMHVPTFLRQCNDLWSMPSERVTQDIALPFLALYFTVCTLGLQFMGVAEIQKHFTLEEAHSLPDTWFNAARSSLWAADFVGTHTMENLQSIVLLGVFMNNRDRADAAWALLGAAIKMAQGLGLSRLGAEQQSIDGKPLPMWTGRWESLIQREVGRRIWWNLVFLDWALAPSYNFSCCIQPDQIKTALPANVEDEDIIDGQPLKPQPLNVRTGMSFQLARLKFVEITQRQIWQANNNNHPPYSFILSVDGELRKAMMELPSFFQPDSSARGPPSQDPKALVQYYEKIMLNLAIHSRMLRLHRPWLSRGYEDERFAYSKEQCIRAARASLRMMSDADGTASFLEKWWLPLFYVSVSGLVVIIDLLRTHRKDMFSSETEEKIAEVKGALDQMRGIADISHPSRAAVKVMDMLMLEVEAKRRPPGSSLGKRKNGSPEPDDEESGLQRAVKKLIRQAALEADSPNTPISASGSTPQGSEQALLPSASPHKEREKVPYNADSERPVFGAYPMPFNPVQPTITNATTPTPTVQPFSHPHQIVGVGNNSPFTFPVDTTSATSFPNFDMRSFGGGIGGSQPPLDPAVQSMLNSYFPSNNSGNQGMGGPVGSATAPQAPDDFLSKVFGFGWDGIGTTGAPPPSLHASAQPQQHGGMMNGQMQQQQQHFQSQPPQQGQQDPQQQGQQQQQMPLHHLQGVGENGFGGGGYGGWGSHGWMA
ncbi:hypothetical protein IAR55_005533 [Kwoniella newhampshirensis]|uniref:Zn(2)-C6 fungal-type domain-containing protein n=1 Tax=Kwoniella newhampshirensis TaxID=1651941 RepID=A0AAW0YMH7_9TREE